MNFLHSTTQVCLLDDVNADFCKMFFSLPAFLPVCALGATGSVRFQHVCLVIFRHFLFFVFFFFRECFFAIILIYRHVFRFFVCRHLFMISFFCEKIFVFFLSSFFWRGRCGKGFNFPKVLKVSVPVEVSTQIITFKTIFRFLNCKAFTLFPTLDLPPLQKNTHMKLAY